MEKKWSNTLDILQKDLSASAFERWIKPIKMLEWGNEKIVLGFPDQFSIDWTKEHYLRLIAKKIGEKVSGNMRIVCRIRPEDSKPATPAHSPRKAVSRQEGPEGCIRAPRCKPAISPRFTFEEFIVGPENLFAFEAARAMVQPDHLELYNPLFLAGDVGIGKTHLAAAVINHLRHRNPSIKAHYTSAESFFNEMVASLRNDKVAPFKEKYRDRCDALVIDDVEFFQGKKKTQLELFHTFDSLYHRGKLIIFVGRKKPKDIPGMEEGLRSRLGSGLVVELYPPSLETRRRILTRKARTHDLTLPDDVLDFLAETAGSNVRTIEAVLKRLAALSKLLKQPLNLDLAHNALANIRDLSPLTTSIGEIRELVTKYFQLSPGDLSGPSRRARIAHARQITMFLCRRHTEESLEMIGRAFNRKHTSVLHSIRVIEKKMKENRQTRNHINFFTDQINEIKK